MIGLILLPAFLLLLYAYWFGSRPSQYRWYPIANAERGDSVTAYQRAAKNLGIRITVRGYVPAPAGEMCRGLRGIYVLREQAHARDDLVRAMFDEMRAMRS